MKKLNFIFFIIILVIFLVATPVLAVSESRVTIGKDNNENQIAEVYKFFRIKRGDVPEIIVTNNEEKQYLSSFVPEAKIGDVALSCSFIETKDNGGIELETFNINWVTDEMYKNALATAGIKNAKVIVAASKPVSGTGALTGILKAYEDITGEKLDESYKSLATEELIVTGDLQTIMGQASPEFINNIKAKLAQTKSMSDSQIKDLIVKTASEYNATLTEDQITQILKLIKQMNELGMEPDEFIKLAQAGKGIEGFFSKVNDFFQGVGNFFKGIFGN